MLFSEFVENTVCHMDTAFFESVKTKILDTGCISFSVMNPGNISADVFAEKLCDYLEAVEIKNNRPFDKQIESYMNDLDAIVSPRIVKTTPSQKGNNTPPVTPRAYRYYEKAISSKGNKNLTVRQLLDYTRLMMCLYTSSIRNNDKAVENFVFSANCLDLDLILEHLKKEEIFFVIPPNKRKRFELKEKYSSDTCTFVLITVALCAIISERPQEV